VLHGALGGLILFAIMGAEKPSLPEPFRWDVAFLPAAPSAPVAQVQPAAPLPVPRPSRVVAPDPVVTRQAAPDAAADAHGVTEAVAPVQQQAVVSAAPTIEQAELSEPEAPPPSAVADTGWLADLLWRRMEALKRYPYLARRNGWEGQVLIKAIIGADGRLLHAEIQQSSGHEALDQDALKVLRASTPLELEQNPSWQQATLTIPVAYRLQR
jgi:protein TonB